MKATLRYFAALLAATLCIVLATPAGAQSYPPAWSSTAIYHSGDQVQVNGNVYRCLTNLSVDDVAVTNYLHWELWDVRNSTNLTIGKDQQFPTLVAAWNYILEARIAPAATVNLNIITRQASFNETFAQTFSLDHPFGSQISILGDNLDNIYLTFTNTTANAFSIDSGHSLAALSNMQILGPSNGGNGGAGNALNADQNSSVGSISWLYCTNYNGGMDAMHGSTLNCASNLQFASVINLFRATYNSVINVGDGFICNDTNYNDAFFADFGSQIVAHSCSITNAQGAAAAAYRSSNIDVTGGSIKNCVSGYGAFADKGGKITAEKATITGNSIDVSVSDGGTIDAIGATYTNVSNDNSWGSYIITS